MNKITLSQKDLDNNNGNGGLEIYIKGAAGNPQEDPGCVAFIEYYKGELRICIWDNTQDPQVIPIKHYSPEGSTIEPLYCPCCQQDVKRDPSNETSIADHGKCTDCLTNIDNFDKWVLMSGDGDLIETEENPYYPKSDWIIEVTNGDTSLGYEEWVEHCEERDKK